jgi:hypothetical protein
MIKTLMLLFIFIFIEIILKVKEAKSFFVEAKRIIIYIMNKYTWIDDNNDNKFYLQFLSVKFFLLKSLYLFILYNLVNSNFNFFWFKVLRWVSNCCGVF